MIIIVAVVVIVKCIDYHNFPQNTHPNLTFKDRETRGTTDKDM